MICLQELFQVKSNQAWFCNPPLTQLLFNKICTVQAVPLYLYFLLLALLAMTSTFYYV